MIKKKYAQGFKNDDSQHSNDLTNYQKAVFSTDPNVESWFNDFMDQKAVIITKDKQR